MNKEQVNAIEMNRQQIRILNSLTAAFDAPRLKESRLLVAEAVTELEEYEKKVYQVEQPTVTTLVKSMYELCFARFDDEIDREVVQDLFCSEIEQLAALLGIELELEVSQHE